MMSGPLPQSQYPPAPHYGPYPGPDAHPYANRPTNALAIVSLICAVLFPPLGVVFGHIALHQIKRSGEEGRGVAIAGLLVGYMLTVFFILLVVAVVVLLYQFKDLFSLIGIFVFFSWLFPPAS